MLELRKKEEFTKEDIRKIKEFYSDLATECKASFEFVETIELLDAFNSGTVEILLNDLYRLLRKGGVIE